MRGLAIAPAMVETIADSALYRLQSQGGISTHSPRWSHASGMLHEELGLSRSRKTIVAYVSSTDEIVASRAILEAMGRPYSTGPRPFEDQTEWLHKTLQWVATRPDCQIVVRLHPRMATNVRSATKAAEYDVFRREFADLPDNAIVVWPEDPTSSYNLAEIADAAVVAWSTMALELARLGVPVVAAFDEIGSFPTGGFVAYEKSAPLYFRALERAIEAPADIERVKEAFRWTYFAFWAPGVDVSDLIPTPDYDEIPEWRLPRNRDAIVRVLGDGADMSALNLGSLAQDSAARSAEEQAVLSSLSRFVTFFLTGDVGTPAPAGKIRAREGAVVELDRDGGTTSRFSPLGHRLANILQARDAPMSLGAASQ